MKKSTARVAALVAGIVTVFTGSVVASSNTAQAVGPSSCYKGIGNAFGAWHAAYGVCNKGYGHVQVIGTFRNLAGHSYTVKGPWVGIGKTSTAYAAGWLDTAVSARIDTRFT